MYNLERLREDIDLRKILPSILSYDEIKYSGSTMYAKCVSGTHSESKIEHNAVTPKYCHCFSCGETYDAFTYISKYYELQGLNLSFAEICEKIGDALGGASYYEEEGKIKKTKLPLTQEELQIIGLSTSASREAPSLAKLYEENPNKIKYLIKQRAYESMIRNKNLSEEVEDPALQSEYRKLYNQCRDIYQKLGGTDKRNVTLFKNM